MDYLDLLGFLGTGICLLSFVCKEMKQFRIVNLIGVLIFGTYGLLIDDTPVVILQFSIALLNIYHLHTLFKTQRKGL